MVDAENYELHFSCINPNISVTNIAITESLIDHFASDATIDQRSEMIERQN